MITPGQLLRVFAIARTLVRNGFDELLLTTPLLRSVGFLLYLLPWNWVRRQYDPPAVRIRRVLQELGPIFVKFGQIVSTRRDVLSDAIAVELSQLQDNVPPFPGSEARAIVERAYGRPLSAVFAEFDETPLASASIAQVHCARMMDGRDVIVKVVRPNLRKTIASDIGLMRILADAAQRYTPHGKRLKPMVVVEEFEKTILDELDMMREAANATQLRRNFAGSELMHVPEVVWELTRSNVLVLERIHGIPVANTAQLVEAGIDLSWLARVGVEVFFTQVFRDHFFHADLHPGNLFVIPATETRGPCFAPVDFGIMGSISEFDQRYLAENFGAFLDRDYRRVAELHVESGWVPRTTRVDEFEFAIRAVCEPIFDRPVKDISVGSLLLRLFQTAQRFHMEILPQLLLLQKTIVNVEGIGRQLDPNLDLWAAARPSLESWMRDRLGPRSVLRSLRKHAPGWADRLPELPGLALEVLDQIKNGRVQLTTHDPLVELLRGEIECLHRRVMWSLIGVGLLVAGSIVLWLGTNVNGSGGFALLGPRLGPVPLAVWMLGGSGCAALIAALRVRNQRA